MPVERGSQTFGGKYGHKFKKKVLETVTIIYNYQKVETSVVHVLRTEMKTEHKISC